MPIPPTYYTTIKNVDIEDIERIVSDNALSMGGTFITNVIRQNTRCIWGYFSQNTGSKVTLDDLQTRIRSRLPPEITIKIQNKRFPAYKNSFGTQFPASTEKVLNICLPK